MTPVNVHAVTESLEELDRLVDEWASECCGCNFNGIVVYAISFKAWYLRRGHGKG